MSQFTMQVTYSDGTDATVELTLDDWCAWEEWSGKTFQQLGDGQVGARDLAYLTWSALKRRWTVPVPFEEWRTTVATFPTIVGSQPRPTRRGRSGVSASS